MTCLMERLSNVQSQLALVLVSHDKGVIRYAEDLNEIESGLAARRRD